MVVGSILSDSSRGIGRLRGVRRRSTTLPWGKVGVIVKSSIMSNFIVGGSPKKWESRKLDVPWPILRHSNELMNSFYIELLANGVAVGTRKVYAAVHNFGYPQRNITQRKYVMAQREDIVIIGELFRRHLTS